MRKIFQKRSGGIIILFMLGISPLTVSYSYSEEIVPKSEKTEILDQKERKWKIILTEKVVDGKLELSQYTVSNDFSKNDMHEMLLSEGRTNWTHTTHKAYQTGIVLFDGKASKIDEKLWKVSSDEISNPSNELPKPDSSIILDKTIQNEEFSYKVIFSGKMTESYMDSNFLISLMSFGLNDSEDGQNLGLNQSKFSSLEKPNDQNLEFGLGFR